MSKRITAIRPNESPFADYDVEENEEDRNTKCVQWSTSDHICFLPTSTTVSLLTPGTYDIHINQTNGIYFEKIPVVTSGLLKFPETNSERIVGEIQKFWERESLFRDYRLNYKRGIMLYGPPGSGKSSTIQLVMQDVIDRGGVVINFKEPGTFVAGVRKFREIQPNTPMVVLMEDIDSTLDMYSESEVLNVLDGVNQIDKVVFLATTNYPEKLGERILNRPSRFDKRFKIGHPNQASRRLYFEFIIGKQKIDELKIDIEKWVKETEGYSVAHLKELFITVAILGDEFEDALATLNAMREESISSTDDQRKMGFL
jgi:SpoVK/Ycf46/Vps4 family AAA+-type ATPase